VLARSGPVITATNGAEGLAAARREKPEVVVVDLDLPEPSGDGVDLVEQYVREWAVALEAGQIPTG
jgi:DNA-binding response OmpR family regulator